MSQSPRRGYPGGYPETIPPVPPIGTLRDLPQVLGTTSLATQPRARAVQETS